MKSLVLAVFMSFALSACNQKNNVDRTEVVKDPQRSEGSDSSQGSRESIPTGKQPKVDPGYKYAPSAQAGQPAYDFGNQGALLVDVSGCKKAYAVNDKIQAICWNYLEAGMNAYRLKIFDRNLTVLKDVAFTSLIPSSLSAEISGGCRIDTFKNFYFGFLFEIFCPGSDATKSQTYLVRTDSDFNVEAGFADKGVLKVPSEGIFKNADSVGDEKLLMVFKTSAGLMKTVLVDHRGHFSPIAKNVTIAEGFYNPLYLKNSPTPLVELAAFTERRVSCSSTSSGSACAKGTVYYFNEADENLVGTVSKKSELAYAWAANVGDFFGVAATELSFDKKYIFTQIRTSSGPALTRFKKSDSDKWELDQDYGSKKTKDVFGHSISYSDVPPFKSFKSPDFKAANRVVMSDNSVIMAVVLCSTYELPYDSNPCNFGVFKVKPDGSLDASFNGGKGYYEMALPSKYPWIYSELALIPDFNSHELTIAIDNRYNSNVTVHRTLLVRLKL